MIRADGKAVVEAATGERFEISSSELDWNACGGDERGMGAETLYEAEVEREDRNGDTVTVRWEASEYPVGALNHVTNDVKRGTLVANFSFSWEHKPE